MSWGGEKSGNKGERRKKGVMGKVRKGKEGQRDRWRELVRVGGRERGWETGRRAVHPPPPSPQVTRSRDADGAEGRSA